MKNIAKTILGGLAGVSLVMVVAMASIVIANETSKVLTWGEAK